MRDTKHDALFVLLFSTGTILVAGGSTGRLVNQGSMLMPGSVQCGGSPSDMAATLYLAVHNVGPVSVTGGNLTFAGFFNSTASAQLQVSPSLSFLSFALSPVYVHVLSLPSSSCTSCFSFLRDALLTSFSLARSLLRSIALFIAL